MRAIVIVVLVVANVLFLLYSRFIDTPHGSEPWRLQQQVNPDKIQILTPQQVAALGPAKMAALTDVCAEWGPFSDADRARALADLDALQLGRLLSQRRVDVDNAYWVSVGPFATRSAAEARLAELRTQGQTDIAVADAGRGQYAVSLGIYRTEQAANARAEALTRLGIRAPRVEPRGQSVPQTTLVVRDPQQPVVARLKDLQAQYADSDLKIGPCPPPI